MPRENPEVLPKFSTITSSRLENASSYFYIFGSLIFPIEPGHVAFAPPAKWELVTWRTKYEKKWDSKVSLSVMKTPESFFASEGSALRLEHFMSKQRLTNLWPAVFGVLLNNAEAACSYRDSLPVTVTISKDSNDYMEFTVNIDRTFHLYCKSPVLGSYVRTFRSLRPNPLTGSQFRVENYDITLRELKCNNVLQDLLIRMFDVSNLFNPEGNNSNETNGSIALTTYQPLWNNNPLFDGIGLPLFTSVVRRANYILPDTDEEMKDSEISPVCQIGNGIFTLVELVD